MISASHNPFYDNGIKLLNGNGQKIEAEVEARIEAYLDGKLEELPLATGEDIGRTVDFASGRNRYIGYLISIPCRDFKNIRVGLDCSNGSSSAIAKSVFDALRAKTYVINNDPDGTNINTNCGSTHIEVLQRFVVEKGLDVGFAYDGDADRCLCVDEKGNVITGDHILYIYGKYMKERGKLLTNTVVTTVMSNFGLYKALDKALQMTPEEVIEEIKVSGLAGRGGAGFPTAVKLAPKNLDEIDTLLINGAECEPISPRITAASSRIPTSFSAVSRL